MSSGEWDLRALKALEEEEQKEFLALSQKSLFEPPSPPAGSAVNGGTASVNVASGGKQTNLTYAQLHPHLLKLPTIDECQLIAAAKRRALHGHGSSASTSGGRLKFTRALSLSAHSLTARGTAAGGGGGFGKKIKAKLIGSGVGTKSSGSLSPSHYSYSVSPVYTPPPIRRCATLHHTQPVRKTFKTLQQMERQKKQYSNQSSRSPQPQRIAGGSKTFWKYGANSTAASIIGQRVQASKLRLQTQTFELDANGSDVDASESPEVVTSVVGGDPAAFDDSATETGSCSVPLPQTGSNEVLRLMLNAASSAITTQSQSSVSCRPPDIAAATGGAQQQHPLPQPTFLSLATHRYQSQLPPQSSSNETVAYEAFHALTRRKNTLLRGASLTEQESLQRESLLTASSAVSARKILKSTSLDTAAAAAGRPGTAGGIEDEQVDYVGVLTEVGLQGHNTTTAAAAAVVAPTTLMTAKANANATTIKTNHMCNLAKTSAATATTTKISTAATMLKSLRGERGVIANGLHFNEAEMHTNELHQQQVQRHLHLQDAIELNGAVCYGLGHEHGHILPPDGVIIDDELEQHIKHCSCSCNHMGYGNSMDYQLTQRVSNATINENLDKMKKRGLENRLLAIKEVTEEKFVSKLVNVDQNMRHIFVSEELLNEVNNDPNLLKRIITGYYPLKT